MLKAVAEKKGGGSFLRTLCGRTARPPAGGASPPKRRAGGETPPASGRDERGAAPKKDPHTYLPNAVRAPLGAGVMEGVYPRHLGESRLNGDWRDPDL
jgi:hypothetical protein